MKVDLVKGEKVQIFNDYWMKCYTIPKVWENRKLCAVYYPELKESGIEMLELGDIKGKPAVFRDIISYGSYSEENHISAKKMFQNSQNDAKMLLNRYMSITNAIKRFELDKKSYSEHGALATGITYHVDELIVSDKTASQVVKMFQK